MRRPFTMGDGWSTGGQPGVILGVELIVDLLQTGAVALVQHFIQGGVRIVHEAQTEHAVVVANDGVHGVRVGLHGSGIEDEGGQGVRGHSALPLIIDDLLTLRHAGLFDIAVPGGPGQGVAVRQIAGGVGGFGIDAVFIDNDDKKLLVFWLRGGQVQKVIFPDEETCKKDFESILKILSGE